MNDRRPPRSMIVAAPRVGDAIGAALRTAFRGGYGTSNEWDACLRRIDRAELDRRG